jgi:hypothetical protein
MLTATIWLIVAAVVWTAWLIHPIVGIASIVGLLFWEL